VKVNEYLESVFKDAFKRELEVDENVARTLPFFAATLALVVTLYGYATTKLPPLELRPLNLLLHLLLVAGAGCLAGVVYSLFQAVRVREYRIPPKETEQIAWAESLRVFYSEQGLEVAAADEKVAGDLRNRMLVEFAEGAEHNRAANAPKLKARAQGFTLLVAALGIAFLMIAIIFTTDRLRSDGHAREPHEHPPRQEHDAPAAAAIGAASAAPAAQAAGPASGREVPGGAGGEHGAQVSDTNDAPQSGGQPAQQPAQPATPPPPPTHQLLKKSEDGGGPIKGR
jgi:4-amino-4-deoxy-L-arabinose transferase-like glycosyltransferase